MTLCYESILQEPTKHVLHLTTPTNGIDNQFHAILVLYFSIIFINFWLIELTTQYILSDRINLLN